MHRCSYAHEFDILPREVRETLEAESYAAFVGVPQDGASETPGVPRPLAATTHRLLATASFAALTRGNHFLSERIAHEAVNWCNTEWARLEHDDPFRAESAHAQALGSARSLAEARRHVFNPDHPDEGRLPAHRHRLMSRARALLAEPRMAATDSADIGERVETRARIALLAAAWQREVTAERERFQTRNLGKALGSFIRELEDLVPRLARAQSVVRDLFGDERTLWDLSPGAWRTVDADTLAESARLLRELPELDRLAEILGRSQTATETRHVTRVTQQVRFVPVGIGKSEVTGVSFGSDLTSLLASEIALLANETTADLFYAKLAHKELLQLDYRREHLVKHVRTHRVSVAEEVVVPRGPVIICVDTSGSMLGTPEQVAKAMTLALARRLSGEARDIYLIAFSTDTRAVTLGSEPLDLAKLCAFLGGSFAGGTDLRPALSRALDQLEGGRFRHADVLVISDFKIPKIADRFIDRIKAQQRQGTLFHTLTVASAPVRDPLNIFDNSWLFNVSAGMQGIDADTLRFLG